MHLRQAGPEDADRIASLCVDHAAFERLCDCPFNQGWSARLARLILTGDIKVWMIEDAAGAVAGYASVSLQVATLGAYRYAHLDCLYLRPAARRKGLGNQMIKLIRRYAADSGCRELQWQTPDWNQDAVQFYEAMGADSSRKIRFRLSCAC